MAQDPTVAIIELGSQYTLLIERTLRELSTRSVILDPKRAGKWLENHPVKAIILSGGKSSVYDKDAPQPPEQVLSITQDNQQPVAILGICYGMQWLTHRLGGEVKPVPGNREYGEAEITFEQPHHEMFNRTPQWQPVWMSHGDSVVVIPEGFKALAHTQSGTIAAMSNGSLWGVQFHPEVTHTLYGKVMLANFLERAKCERDWQPSSIVTSIQKSVSEQVGKGKAIFGFSGGVDSTTVSAILAPILGKRLRAVTIDGGNLREGELDEIELNAKAAKVNLRIVNARGEFNQMMSKTIDAQEKRQRFKEVYKRILIREALEFGAEFVLQGTLAPDRIESGATGAAVIKSHHNVGLDMGSLIQLDPVAHLFKYEVRALAQEVGLPESVWSRQPFPGPGLFLRVVGTPATPDKLEIVRWADARVRDILTHHGVYNQISQLVVAYIAANTVGVKGDGRVYGGAIVVRAVETPDFMTVRGVHLSDEIESEISTTLTKHRDIVRVWYDPTEKPPATTEME